MSSQKERGNYRRGAAGMLIEKQRTFWNFVDHDVLVLCSDASSRWKIPGRLYC